MTSLRPCSQTEYARLENGRFVYRIHRSPMCEYMVNFIHKLKHLPEKYMMNSVLENFTILQVGRRAAGCLGVGQRSAEPQPSSLPPRWSPAGTPRRHCLSLLLSSKSPPVSTGPSTTSTSSSKTRRPTAPQGCRMNT